MSSTVEHNDRRSQYKNAGKHDEMRRRRAEGSVELRKQKKEDQLMKRRNLNDASDEVESDENIPADPTSPNSPNKKNTDINKANGILPLAQCVKMLVKGEVKCVDDIREATISVRKLLSSSAKNPPIDDVIRLGLIPPLIRTLEHADLSVQLESAWALTNIVSGTSDQTAAVVDSEAIDVFMRVMTNTQCPNLLEQIIWAVANIAGDGPIYRDQLIKAGIIPVLNQLLTVDFTKSPTVLAIISWAYSNLCRHKKSTICLKTAEKALPAIIWLMTQEHPTVRGDACWALSYLSDAGDEYIESVIQHKAIPQLLNMLVSQNKSLIAPALRTLGNIVTGSDSQTQTVIDSGVLKLFAGINTDELTPILCKEICWMLSNILAGTPAQIDCVLDAGLGPFLIEQLNKGDYKTQSEAAWAFNNLTMTGDPHQVSRVIELGLLPPLAKLLTTKDPKLVTLILDTIENCLKSAAKCEQLERLCELVEECGGLDSIESLQEHENSDIYKKAAHIIEAYFGTEEEEDKENYSPVDLGAEQMSPEDGFQF